MRRPSFALGSGYRHPRWCLASVDHDQPLSGRIYRLVEADPVTRDATSGRRGTGMKIGSRLDVCFRADYVRFAPSNGHSEAHAGLPVLTRRRHSRFRAATQLEPKSSDSRNLDYRQYRRGLEVVLALVFRVMTLKRSRFFPIKRLLVFL